MTDTYKTFGDFFDAVRETEIVEGQIWMDEYRDLLDEARWQKTRQMQLTDELVTCFAQNMVVMFGQRMLSICTHELYVSTGKRGHAFLTEVRNAAQRFGVDVSQVIDVPITPTEAVARASRARPHN
ncbi:MAG: hypothetical protein WEA04_02445 [Candidatus Andersenbacteria bacterium]